MYLGAESEYEAGIQNQSCHGRVVLLDSMEDARVLPSTPDIIIGLHSL